MVFLTIAAPAARMVPMIALTQCQPKGRINLVGLQVWRRSA
jgi:hypothetical protein